MAPRRDTKTDLIDATRAVIREQGLPQATAREITGRAGANLAAIPYHFGSKDDLVAAALLAEARELVAPVLALLSSDRPAEERAVEAVAALNQLFEAAKPQVPGFLTAVAAAPHQPKVQQQLAELWRDLRTMLAADIAQQLAAGRLPSWVAPDAMAALILDVVHGVIASAVIDHDGPDHTAVAGQFLFLLLAVGRPQP